MCWINIAQQGEHPGGASSSTARCIPAAAGSAPGRVSVAQQQLVVDVTVQQEARSVYAGQSSPSRRYARAHSGARSGRDLGSTADTTASEPQGPPTPQPAIAKAVDYGRLGSRRCITAHSGPGSAWQRLILVPKCRDGRGAHYGPARRRRLPPSHTWVVS